MLQAAECFLLVFFSYFDKKLYVSATAVAISGPAVAGGADADGRGSGRTFHVRSCGITAVSGDGGHTDGKGQPAGTGGR